MSSTCVCVLCVCYVCVCDCSELSVALESGAQLLPCGWLVTLPIVTRLHLRQCVSASECLRVDTSQLGLVLTLPALPKAGILCDWHSPTSHG